MHNHVRKLRKEQRLTQAELAKKAQVSRATISGLENGLINTSKISTLKRISEALGSEIGDIFLP